MNTGTPSDAAVSKRGAEVGVVEVLIARASAEHRPGEAKVGHRASKLARGLGGRRGRERGKAQEARGMGRDRRGQAVVRPDGEVDARPGSEVVQGGRGHREHLDVDAGLVHEREPARPEVVELRPDLAPVEGGALPLRRGRRPRGPDPLRQEVLLDPDQPHRPRSTPGARASFQGLRGSRTSPQVGRIAPAPSDAFPPAPFPTGFAAGGVIGPDLRWGAAARGRNLTVRRGQSSSNRRRSQRRTPRRRSRSRTSSEPPGRVEGDDGSAEGS